MAAGTETIVTWCTAASAKWTWDEELSQIVRVQGTNEVRIYSKPSDDEKKWNCIVAPAAVRPGSCDRFLFQQRFETQRVRWRMD
ncbi:MAG: hypothetical protein IPP22_15065 [Nitrosomonas sp.]|nr:hypothetical protein [Nitrosomonas sp.]